MVLLPVVGFALGRGVDARRLIAAGLIVMGAGCFWMANLNLDISPIQVIFPRVVTIAGLSLIFAPLNVAAYMYLPKELRPAAVGLFSLLRNEGGSVGTSIAQTLEERREIFHAARLGENLDPLNPAVVDYTSQTQSMILQQTGDPVGANQMALQTMDNLRSQQAAALAYFDTFWLFAALAGLLAILVFLMRKSAAEKGAHIAAE